MVKSQFQKKKLLRLAQSYNLITSLIANPCRQVLKIHILENQQFLTCLTHVEINECITFKQSNHITLQCPSYISTRHMDTYVTQRLVREFIIALVKTNKQKSRRTICSSASGRINVSRLPMHTQDSMHRSQHQEMQ